jgi:hypothetical protein
MGAILGYTWVDLLATIFEVKILTVFMPKEKAQNISAVIGYPTGST